MKEYTVYECEGCGMTSREKLAIEECEATTVDDRGFRAGDLVHAGENYGWWSDDESWFLPDETRERGSGAHGSGRAGRPLYVILALVPLHSNLIDSHIKRGPSSHELVARIYSPAHANVRDGKERLAWVGLGRLTKVGSIGHPQLGEYQSRNFSVKARLL